jgi:hypothetical protein
VVGKLLVDPSTETGFPLKNMLPLLPHDQIVLATPKLGVYSGDSIHSWLVVEPYSFEK